MSLDYPTLPLIHKDATQLSSHMQLANIGSDEKYRGAEPGTHKSRKFEQGLNRVGKHYRAMQHAINTRRIISVM